MTEQRPRRVSETVREGPRVESRSDQGFVSSVHEIFNCCDGETTCHHRKSLSTDLRSMSWSRISDIPADLYPFAMESALTLMEERKNRRDLLEQNSQSEEDILDDFQRAVRCLKSEFKTFAAANFDRFIKENEARAMNEVWPNLEVQLRKTAMTDSFGENFHEPASRKFPFAIIKLYETGNGESARKLLAVVFDLLLSENQEISNYWVDCLEKLIEACNSVHVQQDIFPTIVGRFVGKGSTVSGKIGACRLLRKLATRFNHEVIQKKILPLMEVLAKDKEPMVRTAATISLPEMLHRIKKKDQALQLINFISADTHPSVRSAITSTIVQSVTLMNPSDPRNKSYFETVMQTIKGLVKDAFIGSNIDVLVAYSNCMGRVSRAFSIAKIMQPRDTLWYLDTFLQLSRYLAQVENEEGTGTGHANHESDTTPPGFANFRANMQFNRRHSIVEALISTKPVGHSDKIAAEMAAKTFKAIATLRANAEDKRMSIPYGGGVASTSNYFRHFGPDIEKGHLCRVNAAKEFYDFMLFAKPIVEFRHGLHPLVVDLMHDTRPEVRAAMAQQILPIMEYLGPEAALLHGELVYGLTDDDLDVIQALVPNMSRILKCLVAAKVLSPERMTPKLVEIGGAILYCEERLNQTTFYNVHQTMLEQFSTLPLCLPGDYIYTNFVPALFHRLRHMRQMPCRMAAANAIVIFLRHCRRNAQREDIRKKIKEGFAHGRSVHDRMLFLYMAKKIMEKFSKKYFRDNFFEDVLVLANDPIGNVRRKVFEIVPELQQEIADDPSLNRRLEETFSNARKSEMDRDVKETLDDTLTKLKDKNKVGNHRNGSDSRNKKVRDAADEAKAVEEEYIASLESYDGATSSNATFNEKRRSFFGTGSKKVFSNPTSKSQLAATTQTKAKN